MYYSAVFFVIGLLLMSCTVTSQDKGYLYGNKLAANLDKRLREKGYVAAGSGGSYIGGTIRKVIRNYYTQKEQFRSIEEARRAIIPLVEEFLATFNTDTHVRPSLHHFPFGIRDIDLSIVCVDTKGKFLREPYIYNVTCNRHGINYSIWPANGCWPKTIYEETFEQAKAILEKEKTGK